MLMNKQIWLWRRKVELETKHAYLKVNLGDGKEAMLDLLTDTCLFLLIVVGGGGKPKTKQATMENTKTQSEYKTKTPIQPQKLQP